MPDRPDSSPEPPASVPYDPVATELAYVKQNFAYRLARRLTRSSLYRAARWIRTRNRRIVSVRALGRTGRESSGTEVWLLAVHPNADAPPVPWDFIPHPRWLRRPGTDGAFAHCLVTDTAARLAAPVDQDPALHFLAHRWSGHVQIAFRGRRLHVDLGRDPGGVTVVYPARPDDQAVEHRPGAARLPSPSPRTAEPAARNADDEAFIAEVRAANASVIAVHCPRWLGVTASTRALFSHTYAVPPSPDTEPYDYPPARLARHADVLHATGVRHFVFSGGDAIQLQLARLLRQKDARTRCDLLWHGPYYFFSKDYDWKILTAWLAAARAGEVHAIATVKKGMERFLQKCGIRSHFLMNFLDQAPADLAQPPGPPHRIGMWFSGTIWKPPFAMLAALRLVDDCRLHAINLGPRAREVCDEFQIPVDVWHDRPLPPDQLHAEMRRTHLTLYVTFTECSPMLPLESFACGVPCLIGPASHLFETDPDLAGQLVVPYPDRADVIAGYLAHALNNRADLLARYRRWVADYNATARAALTAFLADGVD